MAESLPKTQTSEARGAAGWGERLRARGRELGMNDTQVADSIGMTQRRYSSYVNQTREPNFVDLLRICSALATTPDYVLGASAVKPIDDAERRVIMALRAMPVQVRVLAVGAVEGIVRATPGRRETKATRGERVATLNKDDAQ